MSSPRSIKEVQNTDITKDECSEVKESYFVYSYRVKSIDQEALKIKLQKVMQGDMEGASLHEQYLSHIEESQNNPDQPRKTRLLTWPAKLNEYSEGEDDSSESENSVVDSSTSRKKFKSSTLHRVNSQFHLMGSSFSMPPAWNMHNFSVQGNFPWQTNHFSMPQSFFPYGYMPPIAPINNYGFLSAGNTYLPTGFGIDNVYMPQQLMQSNALQFFAPQLSGVPNFNSQAFTPPFLSGNIFPTPLFPSAWNANSYSAPSSFLQPLQSPPIQQVLSIPQIDNNVLINVLSQPLNANATQSTQIPTISSVVVQVSSAPVSSRVADNSVVVAVQEAKSAPDQSTIPQVASSISVPVLGEKSSPEAPSALVATAHPISETKAINTASIKLSEEVVRNNEPKSNHSASAPSAIGLFKPTEKLKKKRKTTYAPIAYSDGTTEDQYWPSYLPTAFK